MRIYSGYISSRRVAGLQRVCAFYLTEKLLALLQEKAVCKSYYAPSSETEKFVLPNFLTFCLLIDIN